MQFSGIHVYSLVIAKIDSARTKEVLYSSNYGLAITMLVSREPEQCHASKQKANKYRCNM
jgi:hypothetical protein